MVAAGLGQGYASPVSAVGSPAAPGSPLSARLGHSTAEAYSPDVSPPRDSPGGSQMDPGLEGSPAAPWGAGFVPNPGLQQAAAGQEGSPAALWAAGCGLNPLAPGQQRPAQPPFPGMPQEAVVASHFRPSGLGPFDTGRPAGAWSPASPNHPGLQRQQQQQVFTDGLCTPRGNGGVAPHRSFSFADRDVSGETLPHASHSIAEGPGGGLTAAMAQVASPTHVAAQWAQGECRRLPAGGTWAICAWRPYMSAAAQALLHSQAAAPCARRQCLAPVMCCVALQGALQPFTPSWNRRQTWCGLQAPATPLLTPVSPASLLSAALAVVFLCMPQSLPPACQRPDSSSHCLRASLCPPPWCTLTALPSAWHTLPCRPTGWQPPGSRVSAGSGVRHIAPPETAKHPRCGSTTHGVPLFQPSLPDIPFSNSVVPALPVMHPCTFNSAAKGWSHAGITVPRTPTCIMPNEGAVHHGQQCTHCDPVSAAATLLKPACAGDCSGDPGFCSPQDSVVHKAFVHKACPFGPILRSPTGVTHCIKMPVALQDVAVGSCFM